MRTPTALLLVGLAALALLIRWIPAGELQLSAHERDLAPSRWLLDDPTTAYHARRVELALASDRAPQFDRYLNHPNGSEIPWSPLFDATLAAVAQRGLRESGADPALGGVEEARLEGFLVRVPPLLGVLSVIAVYWAVIGIASGKRRTWCALAAAAIVAVAPSAVESSSAGRLDHLAWIALLVALEIGVGVRALRSNDALGTVFGALGAGVLAGLGLASFALGLALFAAGWAGYMIAAFTGDAERRKLHLRAGLLFTAVSAFVGRLTLAEGPWEATRAGLMSAWIESTCALALLSAVPFIVGFVYSRERSRRLFQTAVFVVALGALLYNAPAMLRGIARGWSWYRENRALLVGMSPAHASVLEGGSLRWLVGLTPVSIAFVPAWIALSRSWRSPERALVLAASTTTALLCLAELRFAALFVAPMACTLGVALDAELEHGSAFARRAARAIAALSLAVLIAHGAVPWLAERDAARREERIAFVQGLRWMREHTPPPGAWNNPAGPNDWGVLSTFGAAHLIEYHARRPTLASDLALLSGADSAREVAHALLDEDPAALFRCLRSNSARYVVVGPRLVDESNALRRAIGAIGSGGSGGSGNERALEKSMLARLAFTEPKDLALKLDGLELVYASPRLVNADGHAPQPGERAGPAISIYRATSKAVAAPTAEMKAR